MWVDVDIVIGFELESEGRLVVEEVEVVGVDGLLLERVQDL